MFRQHYEYKQYLYFFIPSIMIKKLTTEGLHDTLLVILILVSVLQVYYIIQEIEITDYKLKLTNLYLEKISKNEK